MLVLLINKIFEGFGVNKLQLNTSKVGVKHQSIKSIGFGNI